MSLTRRGFLAGAAAVGAQACAHHELAGPFPKAPHETPPHTVVDVHCHVFNGSDLPIAGFIEKIYNLPPELADPILKRFHAFIDRNAPTGAAEIKVLAPGGAPGAARPDRRQQAREIAFDALDELLIPKTLAYAGSDLGSAIQRFADVVDLVIHYRYEVAAKLAQTYTQVDLFTPAMVDYDYWTPDAPKTPISTQITTQKLVSQLSIRGQLPGAPAARVHPLAPFNPLREVRDKIADPDKYQPFGAGKTFTAASRYDCAAPLGADVPVAAGNGSLALVRHAIEQSGFVGVKIYPPVGFRPLANATLGPQDAATGARLDLALRALYAYAEAEQVPIMSHTGNSNGFAPGYGQLPAPDNWRPVLAEYPSLRVNLAHFGALEGTESSRGSKACEAWIRQAAVLMNAYPNVYADVGCSWLPVYADFAERYTTVLREIADEFPVVKKRLMFGTDFWLNNLSPNAELFVDAFTAALDDAFDADVRRDVMGGNALRFLGLLDDDGKPSNSRAAARLRAFYGAAARPGWLG